MISKVTGFPVHDLGCTLKVIRREFAQELRLYGEMHRFIPILAHWHGRVASRSSRTIVRDNSAASKYGLFRVLRVVVDLIAVKYMLQRPPYSIAELVNFNQPSLHNERRAA